MPSLLHAYIERMDSDSESRSEYPIECALDTHLFCIILVLCLWFVRMASLSYFRGLVCHLASRERNLLARCEGQVRNVEQMLRVCLVDNRGHICRIYRNRLLGDWEKGRERKCVWERERWSGSERERAKGQEREGERREKRVRRCCVHSKHRSNTQTGVENKHYSKYKKSSKMSCHSNDINCNINIYISFCMLTNFCVSLTLSPLTTASLLFFSCWFKQKFS